VVLQLTLGLEERESTGHVSTRRRDDDLVVDRHRDRLDGDDDLRLRAVAAEAGWAAACMRAVIFSPVTGS
jgi:hypothetical protein